MISVGRILNGRVCSSIITICMPFFDKVLFIFCISISILPSNQYELWQSNLFSAFPTMKVLRSKHCPLSSIHPPLHSSSFTRLKGLPLLDTNFYATTWQRLQLSRSLRRPSRVPLDFPTNLSRFYLLKRPCCLYLQVRYSNSLCVVSYTPTPTEQFRIAIFTSRNSSRSPLPMYYCANSGKTFSA